MLAKKPDLTILFRATTMIDLQCLLCAVLLVLSNLCRLVQNTGGARPDFDIEKWEALDVPYLREMWAWRLRVRGWEAAGGVLGAAGYVLLFPPVVTFCVAHSHGGKRALSAHVAIACLFGAAAVCAALDTLMTLGAVGTADWIADDFDLDFGTGSDLNATHYGGGGYGWKARRALWRPRASARAPSGTKPSVPSSPVFPPLHAQVLEITWLTTQGNFVWVDPAVWLMLGVALTRVYFAVTAGAAAGAPSPFSPRWARLGLVVAAFCLLEFALECLRWASWGAFMFAAIGLAAFNSLVLLPVWVVWLGKLLAAAEAGGTFESLELQPGVELTPSLGPGDHGAKRQI